MRIACLSLVIIGLWGCASHPKSQTESVKQVVSPAHGSAFSACPLGIEKRLQASLVSHHSVVLKAEPISHTCYDQIVTWMSQHPGIKSLSMVQMGLSDANLVDLLYDLDQSPIEQLDLSENNLSDASMSALQGYIANSKTLLELKLAKNPIEVLVLVLLLMA